METLRGDANRSAIAHWDAAVLRGSHHAPGAFARGLVSGWSRKQDGCEGEGDEHADGGAEEPASISAGERVARRVAAADERFGLRGGMAGEHRKADRRRQLLRGVEQAGGEADDGDASYHMTLTATEV